MKIATWNVNSLKVRLLQVLQWLKDNPVDILCLQETKVQAGQVDFAPEGYHCYWNYAEKKG